MDYTDMLAAFGIGSAHPGGFAESKKMIVNMDIDDHTVILDCGCGTGQTAAYLKQIYDCHVWAIERHPVMLQKARQRFSEQNVAVSLHEGSIEAMDFPSNSVDIALSESVLAFLDLEKALKEIKRVLAFDGKMYANELICTQSLTSEEIAELKEGYGFRSLFTAQDWIAALTENGFSHVKVVKEAVAEAVQQDESDKGNDLMPSPLLSPDCFAQMQQHQMRMEKFRTKLGHAWIIASRST
ncbi:hypothetical protein CHH65_02895 [Shouchella clausii]|jgi:ubiquinone/menaquinone biosynthesis C-methylase UbiE|uniref:class I SAM-dependent methyltransferase n=1 Tax=Shouchella TaxID=2893057 RepID=UPI000BA748C6|nr:class I SAM-dependent methyltransferase [Shouchella clausii]PAF10818.1 hypothetical protein CHH65_02895 [Shouchella clausii]